MKINELMEQFINYAVHLERKSKSTTDQYKTATRRFQSFLEGKYRKIPEVSDITIADLIDFWIYLDELVVHKGISKKKTTKLSHNTKIALITTIKTFFKRCKLCKISCLDYEMIPVARQERNEICYLSHDEINNFFSLAKKEKQETIRLRNELFFRIAYFTGLRKGEILNLTFDDILHQGQFQVVQKFKRKRTVFFDENSKIREIALQLKCLYNLKPKNQIYYHEDKDYVFLCLNDPQRGKKRERGGANTVMDKYKKKLGIKRKVTIHSFRHTHATTLLERGVDLRQVQIMLGHATISSTQVYTHISESKLREATKLLYLE